MRHYYVYILSSRNGALYIGITNNIARRTQEHKEKRVPGFTAKYNINRLVWYQSFPDPTQAIATEKKLKSWRREKRSPSSNNPTPNGETSLKSSFPSPLPNPSSLAPPGMTVAGDINLSLE